MSKTVRENNQGEMDLWSHLAELRKRIVIIAISVSLIATGCFVYAQQIFDFLNAPFFAAFPPNSLIGTGPAEAFMIKLKVAAFSGIILGIPVIFYQLWLFVAPGLHEHEKKLALPFVFSTSALFLLGAWFCYQVVVPFAMDFFISEYRSIGITPTVKLSEQLSMMVQMIFAFGVMFELPVVSFLLGKLGILTDKMMISGIRYAVLVIFIVAGVLTPPDVLTQFLLAIPLLALYGVSILIVRWTGRPAANPDSTSV